MRKFIKRLIILLFLGAVTPVFLVLAQPPSTSSLEVSYPTLVPGVAPPRSVQTYLPNYIRYLYTGAIALGGLIAFSSLLLGGGKYLTSAGNPAQMKDARDQIFHLTKKELLFIMFLAMTFEMRLSVLVMICWDCPNY